MTVVAKPTTVEVRCPECRSRGQSRSFLFEIVNGVRDGEVQVYRKCDECKRRLRVTVRPGEVSEAS